MLPMRTIVLRVTRVMLVVCMVSVAVVEGALLYSVFDVQGRNFATMKAGDTAAMIILAIAFVSACMLWWRIGRLLAR